MLFESEAEQRLEDMIAQGTKVTSEAIEEYKPVTVFAGFSGGNDSIVATHFACTYFGAAAVHCNTLIGVEKSREHARKTAAKMGWQFIEKKAGPTGPPKYQKKTGLPWDEKVLPNGKWVDGETKYEEFCFNFGFPGPGQHPRMYQILKERSFFALKREAKVGHSRRSCIAIITGVRHDESAIRAGYNRAVKKFGSIVWINPFYFQTKLDFEIYRQEFGLPRNPVTDIVGISGECLCGTMGTRDELDLVERIEPSTAVYVRGIELKCESLGLPCKWATRPPKKSIDNPGQLLLWGDEPTFQPACVGCMRRRSE